jgi:hypothetical protein
VKIIHLYSADWQEACKGMTFEEMGFFLATTLLLYSTRDGRVEDNDRDVAHSLGADIRVYRRLKTRFAERFPRCLPIINGCITNARVVSEIEKYCATQKARREHGREGANRRWGNQDRPDFRQTSAGLPADVQDKSMPASLKNNENSMPTLTLTLTKEEKSLLEHRGDEIFSASAPAAPKIDPMRKRDPLGVNPDAAPETYGLSFDDGMLKAINGTRSELAQQFAGGDEIKLDGMLTRCQGMAGVKLGIHGMQLKSNVVGALARLAEGSVERKQNSRENYDRARIEGKREGEVRRDSRRDGSSSSAKKAPRPPTNDPKEIRKRFDADKQHDPFWRGRYQRDGYTSVLKEYEQLAIKAWNRHNAQLAANR